MFLSACSIKNYEHIEAKIFIFKTSALKFADLAYIRNSGDSIELELFVAGRVIKRIDINNFICVDEGCMSKAKFNAEYLYEKYPQNIFQNIILGKKIYNASQLVNVNGGFEQFIQREDISIKYKVSANKIYFKDRKNGVLIIIKDIKQ